MTAFLAKAGGTKTTETSAPVAFLASALVGAFHAVDPDPVTAAATALAFFGIAGEMAGASASGPGSFVVSLLDALHVLSPDQLRTRCRISAL